MAWTINNGKLYFNTNLYTGDGSTSRSITGVGFQPDWVWVKSRSATYYHALWDVVRTNKSALYSNTTDAEDTGTGGTLGSFNSDGFTLPNESGGFVNNNGTTYASWNWLANGAGSANTDGSISSTVSANTTSGFSIVSYTGNGTSGATVGHGLSSKPGMMIFKERNGTTSWVVYHHKNTSAPATEYLQLNSSNATGDYAGYFNDTEPTSSVFTLGNDTGINQSGDTYIAYCFAEKQGYSKFGSYTGNGNADGTFVYTGFKPAWLLAKKSSGTGDWFLIDNKRSTINPTNHQLEANSTAAEDASGRFDFLSNGFKCVSSSTGSNGSGTTYIYMAFAESPLVSSSGVPTTAR